jgi:hypothetical protein
MSSPAIDAAGDPRTNSSFDPALDQRDLVGGEGAAHAHGSVAPKVVRGPGG